MTPAPIFLGPEPKAERSSGLQRVRAQLASLILAGMESVYAILFAMLLLSEIPPLQTVLGGIFIIGTTVVASFQSSEPTTPTVNSG